MRFGPGEIDGGWSTLNARKYFLEVVEELEPKVRTELLSLRKLIPEDLRTPQLAEMLREPESMPNVQWRSELDELLDEIDDWQRRWNLIVHDDEEFRDWVWKTAVGTLVANDVWVVAGVVGGSHEYTGVFQYSVYLSHETEGIAIKRLDDAWKDHKANLRKTIKGIVQNSRRTLTKTDEEGLQHFRWLVQFQILGQSYEDIMKEYYPELSELQNTDYRAYRDEAEANKMHHVRLEVRKLARFIGLPLRYVPLGRPPKD